MRPAIFHRLGWLAAAGMLIGCRGETAPKELSSVETKQSQSRTTVQKAAAYVAHHETVLHAPWGSGLGELGHRRPEEAMPEGPMSMAIDSRGRIHVLDQVNDRIAIFEGANATGVVALPADSYQDIAIDARDRDVVLARLGAGVIVLSGSGAQAISITGEGLTEGGAATGLFTSPDGVWVESEHQHVVRVADASGAPDRTRAQLPGRPSLDGSAVLRASLAGPASIAVSGGAWQARIDFDLRVSSIRALESDAAGRVYVAAYLVREQSVAPFDIEEEKQLVVVLSPSGSELGRVAIMAPTAPEEQFRSIRVGADGAIYQLVCHDDAATVERFAP